MLRTDNTRWKLGMQSRLFDFLKSKQQQKMFWIVSVLLLSSATTISFATSTAKGYFWIEDMNTRGATTTQQPYMSFEVAGVSACALKCFNDDACESFFYNSETSICHGHSSSFWSFGSFTSSSGVAYFKALCKDATFRFIRKFGTCYKVVENNRKSWYDAEAYCQEHNGWLINLDQTGMFEHFAIEKFSDYTDSVYWVGLTDLITENVFIWNHTGTIEKRKAKRWEQGQPDNDNDGQACVQLNKHIVGFSYKIKYDDAKCDSLKSFICECPLA